MSVELFTDAGANGQTKKGVGAYLIVHNKSRDIEALSKLLKSVELTETNSTNAELRTFLHAIEEIEATDVTVYTDCSALIRLGPVHKKRIEEKFDGREMHQLYKQCYEVLQRINCTFIKVKGHKTTRERDDIDQVFSLVDRHARKELRKNNDFAELTF